MESTLQTLTNQVATDQRIIENYHKQIEYLHRDLDRADAALEAMKAENAKLQKKVESRGEKNKSMRKESTKLLMEAQSQMKTMMKTAVPVPIANGFFKEVIKALPDYEIGVVGKVVSVQFGKIQDHEYYANIHHKTGKRPGYKIYTGWNNMPAGMPDYDDGKLVPDMEALVVEIRRLTELMPQTLTAEHVAGIRQNRPSGGGLEALMRLLGSNAQVVQLQ